MNAEQRTILRSQVREASRLADMTEKEFADQVVELATTLGFMRYHTFRSDRSTPGWPDEALLRERLVLLELKTERGKLSPAQKLWIGRLLQAGVEVYVVRPRDLEVLAKILAFRGHALSHLTVAYELAQAAFRECES